MCGEPSEHWSFAITPLHIRNRKITTQHAKREQTDARTSNWHIPYTPFTRLYTRFPRNLIVCPDSVLHYVCTSCRIFYSVFYAMCSSYTTIMFNGPGTLHNFRPARCVRPHYRTGQFILHRRRQTRNECAHVRALTMRVVSRLSKINNVGV